MGRKQLSRCHLFLVPHLDALETIVALHSRYYGLIGEGGYDILETPKHILYCSHLHYELSFASEDIQCIQNPQAERDTKIADCCRDTRGVCFQKCTK